MLLQEFNELTGFYPSGDLYEEIEAAYTDFKGDKVAFCEAYKANQDGMADAIAFRASMKRINLNAQAEKAAQEAEETAAALNAEIARLRASLEREQEWKPYEDGDNVSQAEYDVKAASVESGAASYMDDGRVYEYLEREFGFMRDSVEVIWWADVMEVNRHGLLRKTGKKVSRRPIYGASDDNYILFRAARWFWEVLDGEIRQHVC